MAGLSNGAVDVLYSPITSANGAKLVLNKGPARKYAVEDMSGALYAQTILTPHALPAFRDATGTGNGDSQDNTGWGIVGAKRKHERDRQDPRKSRRPELPVTGPGKGGRVGASATQHVVQNLVRDTTRDEDVSPYPSIHPEHLFWPRSSDGMVMIDYANFAAYLPSLEKHCSNTPKSQQKTRNGLEVSSILLFCFISRRGACRPIVELHAGAPFCPKSVTCDC